MNTNMSTKYRGFSLIMLLMALNILVTFEPTHANDAPSQIAVNLNFVIPPNIRTIRIGEIQKIIMTARAEGQNLQFAWKLDGPGDFEGNLSTPTIFYLLPKVLDGESATVTISVTVSDDRKEQVTDSVAFTLLAPSATTILTPIVPPTPTPTPIPISIRRVLLKDGKDTLLNPTYTVEPGERVMIAVDMTMPSNRNIGIDLTTIFGKVENFEQQRIIYIAPQKPGDNDIVTVIAMDRDAKKPLVQEAINIAIRDKPTPTPIPEIVPRKELGEALLKAVQNGDLTQVQTLLDEGADVDAQDKDYKTALMWAASQGNYEIVKALLDNGASVGKKTRAGKTALQYARDKKYTEIIQLLIKAGAKD